MDAMIKLWRVFRALALSNVLIAGLLSLFYVFAFLMANSGNRAGDIVIPLLCVFPAGAFVAMAAERTPRYMMAAASLGIPGHLQAVNAAQIAVLVLFVALPVAVSILFGGAGVLPGVGFVCGAAAVGTLVSRYPGWFFLSLIGVPFLLNVTGGPDLRSLTALPAVIVAASLALFYHWLQFPQAIERRIRESQIVPPVLASSSADSGEAIATAPIRPSEMREALARFDALARSVVERGLSYESLGVGLGFFNTRTHWRAVAICTGLAVAAIFFRYLMGGEHAAHVTYALICLGGALQLAARLTTFSEAWTSHELEEGVLKLTPRWPDSHALKQLLLRLFLRVQRGAWVAVVATTSLAWLAGWIGYPQVILGALIMAAGSLMALTVSLSTVVRRVHKSLQWSNVLTLLSCAVGPFVGMLDDAMFIHPRFWSIALPTMLVPGLLALTLFTIRPLQFPATRRIKG